MQSSDFSDVFVSYRRKDVDFTKQLVEALRKEGKECWIDWEDIPPGSEGFTDDIQRGLEGADAFIAILSPDYLDSTYCVDMELGTAIKLGKKIIPIVLKKFDDRPIPHGIGHINWIYFTPHAGHQNTFEESFPKVLDALNLDLAHARSHKNFALRAIDWDKHQRHHSRLLKGQELDAAETWLANAAGKTPEPTDLHRDYILTGRKFATLQQRRVLAGVSAALAVSVVLAILSLIGFQRATVAEAEAVAAQKEAQRRAEINNSLALASAALQPGNEEISVALALEATQIENPPNDVLTALMRAAYPPGKRMVNSLKMGEGFWLMLFDSDVSPDGQWMIANNALMSIATGEKVREFPEAPLTAVVSQFTSDGKQVVIAGDESFEADSIHAGLFDVETGELVREFATDLGVGEVWISADGSKVATADYRGNGFDVAVLQSLTIYDIQTGDVLQTIPITGTLAEINPDFTQFAEVLMPELTAEPSTEPIQIVLKDAATNEVQTTMVVPEFSAIGQIAFHPTGTEFAVTGYAYQTNYEAVSIYSVESGAQLKSLRLQGGSKLEYSPSGRYLLIGTTFESQLALWDTRDGNSMIFSGHESSLAFVGFAGSDNRAVSLEENGTYIVWDFTYGILQHQFTAGENAWLNRQANELIVASGLYDDNPSVFTRYSLTTYEELSRMSIPENLTVLSFSSDFSSFVAQAQDENLMTLNRLSVFDVVTGSIIAEADITQKIPESSLGVTAKFVPEKKQILLFVEEYLWDDATQTELREKAWYLWDLETNTVEPYTVLDEVLPPEFVVAWVLAFHPDGQSLYVGHQQELENNNTQILHLNFTTGEKLGHFYSNFFELLYDGSGFISLENQESGINRVVLRDTQTYDVIETFLTDVYSIPVIDPVLKRGIVANAGGGGGGGPISPSLSFSAGGSSSEFYLQDLVSKQTLWDFGDDGGFVIGFYDDYRLFAASTNAGLFIYRNDSLESLIAWTCANRHVPTLTEEQLAQFNITHADSVCETAG